MYHIGQYVIHLIHGLGKIVTVETTQVDKDTIRFYVIEMEDTTKGPMRIRVPETNAKLMEKERIRPLINAGKLVEVYSRLNKGFQEPADDGISCNRRFREYMEDLSSGDILRTAYVLGRLSKLGKEKNLNFGEMKMRDLAIKRITSEISMVTHMPPELIYKELEVAMTTSVHK